MATKASVGNEPFVSVAPRLGFIGGFDGMRGIGVLIVLVGHLFPEQTDSFNPIVDVFFVISAFLIVSLLMQERRDNNGINLKKFYARRALRLLPNSYACMAAWLVVWGVIKATGIALEGDLVDQVNSIPGNVAAAATYSYHLVYPIGGSHGPLVQFWSLSLEEQFYLVAGFATAFVLARRRRVWIAVGVSAALIAWVWFSRAQSDLGPWPGREFALDFWTRGLRLLWLVRPDALLVGVLLAIFNAKLPDPLSPRAKRVISWLGVAGAIGWMLVLVSSLKPLRDLGLPYVPGFPRDTSQWANVDGDLWCATAVGEPHAPCNDDPWFFRWGFSAMALAVAPLTLCFARTKDAWISRLFSWKVARKVGEMSYSLYVWHLLAFALAGIFVEGSSRIIEVPAKIAVAFGVSWLAHRYIDQVVIRMKMRFATEKVVLDRATGREISLETAQALAKGDASDGVAMVTSDVAANSETEHPPGSV